ncbi:MAG: His-Xaa-Ser system radical SAM maturase HxsC [Pseudomonadota bacterium]
MRRVRASFREDVATQVHRVVLASELACEWELDLQFLVLVVSEDDKQSVEKLRSAGLCNVCWVVSDTVEVGDILVPQPDKGDAIVLFRESDLHHSLLLTNRCNSYCIMCSQPPTKHNDDWLVDEALSVIRHIRKSPAVLGLSGGEPLLLGPGLRTILETIAQHHPQTLVEVLTNGRLLSSPTISQSLLEGLRTNVSWLVPLYGHTDFVHDFVVQTEGAFEETLAGLLALQQYSQPIQLRIVLIEPVLQILPSLSAFIGRNLPFVREVALMACEPIGFALANREHCEVDLLDWADNLEQAARTLRRHQVSYLFMNTPLCGLPSNLRSSAHRSISDWKQVYAAECELCSVKSSCSGLFAWHERGWKPTKLRAIVETSHE